MFNHDYPYGDLHEINLDWVINTVKNNDQTVSGYADRLAAAENNITVLDNSVVGLNTSVDDIERAIGDIQTVVEDQVDDIEQLQTDTTSLLNDVTALGATIETINGNITQLQTAVSGHTTQLGAVENTLENQADDISELQSDMATVEGNISTLTTAQAQDRQDINYLAYTRIPSIETDITDLQSADSSQDVEIADINTALSVETGAGKNKLSITPDSLKSLNTQGTWLGDVYTYRNIAITLYVDENNSIVRINANGTANATFYFRLVPNTYDVDQNTILSGCPQGGSETTYAIVAFETNDANVFAWDTGSGADINSTHTNVNMYIRIASGVTINKDFYPMLRPVGTNSNFVPYIPSVNARVESLEKGHVYSTEEKVVGVWVNGEVLYEKTFINTAPTVGTDGVTVDKYIEYDLTGVNLKRMWGVCTMSTLNDVSIPYFTNSMLFIKSLLNKTENKLQISSNGTDFSNSPIAITIQYTKSSNNAISQIINPQSVNSVCKENEIGNVDEKEKI